MKLPAGWTQATVGEVSLEVRSGFPSGRHNKGGVGIPHIRPMNINRAGAIALEDVKYVNPGVDARRLAPGDIVFNNTNSPALVGKTAVFSGAVGECAFSNHMTRIRAAPGLVPEFVAAQLHYLWMTGQLAHLIRNHVNQASISAKVLANSVVLAVPPTSEQKRIVVAIEEHLSPVEAADRSLASAVERLEHLRQGVLDGVPIGDPVPLEELLREPLRNGLSESATTGGSVRVVTLTAVTRDAFTAENTKQIEPRGRSVDDLWLEPGDLFVQRSNTPELVGTAALYDGPARWAIFPDLLIRVRADQERVTPRYLEAVLGTTGLRSYFRRAAQGIAGSMPKISQPILLAAQIPLPSLDAQREVVGRVDEQLRVVGRLKSEGIRARARVDSLRGSILEAAFSGRLVPQDQGDEPASRLLDRIGNGREVATLGRKRRKVSRT